MSILTLREEYPSLLWPLENRGFDMYYTPFTLNLETGLSEAVKKHNPDVLALSWVQYSNGYKLNSAWLQDLKKQFPELLVLIDATQYLGVEPFNFNHSGMDVLITSGYKWLLAGYGNGVTFFSDRFLEKFPTPTMGFSSTGQPIADKLLSKASGYEPGHQNLIGINSMQFSLNALQDLGLKNIAEKNKKLMNTLRLGLQNLGLLSEAFNENNTATILTFKATKEVHEYLIQNNIRCAWRREGIRVSVNFYNHKTDVEYLLEKLKKYLQRRL